MGSVFPYCIFGIVLIGLGFLNRKGFINTVHWYHRHRVTEENRIPFGKMIGLGNIIAGLGFVQAGTLSLVAFLTGFSFFSVISNVFLVIGLAIGLFFSLKAIIKYNEGLF